MNFLEFVQETAESIPQHQLNFRIPEIALPFDMSLAALCNSETTATTPALNASTVVVIPNLSLSSLKAPTLAISEVTTLESSPVTSGTPMLANLRVEVLFYEAIQSGRLEAEITHTVAPGQSFQHAEYCQVSKSEDPNCDNVTADIYVSTTPIQKKLGFEKHGGRTTQISRNR